LAILSQRECRQNKSPILHAEMACFENAGRRTPAEYQRATLYTTLSPCDMCSGTILLYKIPRVVIGENKTFTGQAQLLKDRGVSVRVMNDERCISMMRSFIAREPTLWNEDIGGQ
jgi:cytosine deaminase